MGAPARRPLGASGIQVSELALGSWRTYERIPAEAGRAVMRKALELGINFLDDARYNDETGIAPMKSGYSEVVFGELFRVSGWKRDEVVLANKLWWGFWPEQKVAAAQGVEPPCAAQLAYSLVRRSPVEDAEMARALDAAGTSVVASFTLDGGALTGKYAEPGAKGRLTEHPNDEFHRAAMKAAGELRALAQRHGTRPAPMAIAFALLNPRVASVLFGATSSEQVAENVSAVDLVAALDDEAVADLGKIGLR